MDEQTKWHAILCASIVIALVLIYLICQDIEYAERGQPVAFDDNGEPIYDEEPTTPPNLIDDEVIDYGSDVECLKTDEHKIAEQTTVIYKGES